MLSSYRLQHVDGQRQSYNSAASRSIRDPRFAAMRLDNCIHERKSQTVPRRMLSFYETLKSPAPDFRWESPTIIFDHEFRGPVMRM